MIDTKFYELKSRNKRRFFSNALSKYHDQREDIVCFNPAEPQTDSDKHNKEYHIRATTVFINDYNESENPIVATITTWGETREDLEEKVKAAKTLLEKLGEEELIERDILSGKLNKTNQKTKNHANV
jgi:hypothetical protein